MATNTLNSRFLICNDTHTNWYKVYEGDIEHKILLKGELGAEWPDTGTDAPIFKMGDGVNKWEDLPQATMTRAQIEAIQNSLQLQIGNLANLTTTSAQGYSETGFTNDEIVNLTAACNGLLSRVTSLYNRMGTAEGDIDALEDRVDDLENATNKDVMLTRIAGGANDNFSARYTLYQGVDANGNWSTTNTTYENQTTGEVAIASFDIAKDMVISSASVITFDAEHPISSYAQAAGVTQLGTYIEIIIANDENTRIYINVKDLVDVYNVERNATEVQLALNTSTNTLSASIVADSIARTKLNTDLKNFIKTTITDIQIEGTNSLIQITQNSNDWGETAVIKQISTDILRNGSNTLILNGGNGTP